MSEIIKREASPVAIFRDQTVKMRPELNAALEGTGVPVDRFIRTLQNAVQAADRGNGRNALLEADRTSLWQAATTAAVLGLVPDGVTGQGYLVPFRGKVQFIAGYRGLITLAYQAGILMEGRVVHEHDLFSYQYGSDPKLQHCPVQDGSDAGKLVAVYAVARSNVMPTTFDVVLHDEIIAIRNASSGYKAMGGNSPWATNFDAMARKTAIRRLGHRMPLVTDTRLADAFRIDAAVEQGRSAYINTDDRDVIEGEIVE
jgi:recombination protein RecT